VNYASAISAELIQHERAQAATLREKGWRRYPKGWRHPNLESLWATADALQLQKEADDGMQDPVCASLRGDVWPL
jgi:hypothetical protein